MTLSSLNTVHRNSLIKGRPAFVAPSLKQYLSTAAQNGFVGAYHTILISSSYKGPSVNIRRSTDNATSDFYSDSNGNMGQSLGAKGTSITSWLNGATGYVTIWYDQSGTGNHATQTITTSQPSLNVTNKYIDFSSPANSFFNLPNGAIPYGNSAYTFVLKHGTKSNNLGGFLGGGTFATTNGMNAFRFNNTGYYNYWYGNDLLGGTAATGNTVTAKYITNVSRTIYVNGVSATSASASGRNSGSGNNTIGVTNNTGEEYLNSQLYFLFIFNVDLTDADRAMVEAGKPPVAFSCFTPSGINLFYNRCQTTMSLNGQTMYCVTLGNNIPSGNNTYYVLVSTNAGTNWSTTTITPSGATSNGDFVSICCTDDGITVFLTTEGGIYKSTNSGASFSAFNTSYKRLYAISCSSTATYLYIMNRIDSKIYVSNNGGTTFTVTGAAFNGGSTWSLGCSSDGQYAIVAGSFSPCYVISGFGSTTVLLPTTDMPNNYYNNVSISSTGMYMLALPTGGTTFYYSANYGISGSWIAKTQPSTPLFCVLSKDGQTIISKYPASITSSSNAGASYVPGYPSTTVNNYGYGFGPNSSTPNDHFLIAGSNGTSEIQLYYY